MPTWYLIVIVVLAAASIFLLLRYRNAGATSRQEERRAESRLGPAHVRDREDARLASMSAEDRAWETATLQRNRVNESRRATLVE